MLKKILVFGMIAAFGFSTSACTKTGIAKVDAVIEKVQAATAKGCNFIPYVETILAALNAMTNGKVPTASQYSQMANSFCAAVTSTTPAVGLMAARVTVGVPTVNIKGTVIPVNGYFVR